MKAYESGSATYFATPPVNVIYALHASLSRITATSPSLEERFKLHREASKQIKDAATELGLRQLPLNPDFASNSMTAVRYQSLSFNLCSPVLQLYFPDGMKASDLLPRLAQKGIVVAGGLAAGIKGSPVCYQ
jgi:alanine-glyoxylate transaminase / serine-glyoxylate transaminase / serine-pyruvate transaminase